MLGSGDEPGPLAIKKVEHRDKILYHKSTTNHEKEESLCSRKIILQSCSIWKMLLSQILKIFLRKSMFTLSCHGESTAARPVGPSLTVYTTIGCRSSRMFPLAGQRYCICASGVTAVTVVSASLRRTRSFPGTAVPPAAWWPRSSPRSVKRYPLQRSAHSLTFQAQRLCGTSNAFLLSQPDCQRFFPLTNSRVIPAVRNTTVLL